MALIPFPFATPAGTSCGFSFERITRKTKQNPKEKSEKDLFTLNLKIMLSTGRLTVMAEVATAKGGKTVTHFTVVLK
ncbi:hypothetical protein HH214_16315 [Mucilaginibacter robiniae]|uniref:Uncharacterized protein n=1 Tax=Mucilaginibacter robiniae TaxID=2728022 RepID=A0A7L5E4U1_9SPHI|nr:hypothetical protein [Mucilaginibacter robiniae]QJD97319.1 hypothetical protein HH214_16315 [Mucilaginibacter robiniae]